MDLIEEKGALAKVAFNIAAHNKVADEYESRHGEIFNDIEQLRLRCTLEAVVDLIDCEDAELSAFDFGCGSGNLTKHLIDLGLIVKSADVSEKFLSKIAKKFEGNLISTFLLNGVDISGIKNNSFDLVSTYSVLHHVPDYLAAVREMVRICKPGGIIYIDHEATEEYWSISDLEYRNFIKCATRFDWKKYFVIDNYLTKIRRFIDPRYSPEGDIHVWPDDHVQWVLIVGVLAEAGCEIVLDESYLLYKPEYRAEVWRSYATKCSDTRVIAARKRRL